MVSLKSGVQVYGLVIFARHTAQPFTEAQVSTLTALSYFATLALINQELLIDVRQDRVNLATAQDQARHWLAREIHDGLAQKLASITMNTEFIKRMVSHDPESAVRELDKLNETFRRANHDVRALLGELKPTTLESKGLAAALQEYVDRLREDYTNINFKFESRGAAYLPLKNEARGTLFNIAQESLTNALKYAEPRHILVRVIREEKDNEDDLLVITIQDDGKGFNVEEERAKARARGSYGLANLDERARLLDGRTEIMSVPGKGTRIRVFIPLRDE
jgi:signal transduction histidine kinase